MSMTYASLIQQVMDYLNRNDQDTRNQVPNFINQAQQKICRMAKTIGFEQYVTTAFTPSVAVYPKPARWRRNISLTVGSINPGIQPPPVNANYRNPVMLRTYDYLSAYWPDRTQTGFPLFYADYGFDNFLVAPTPDQAYPFELCYLEIPVTLSATDQTNWLTNFAPDVLLNGTLLEAIPYIKNDERIPIWEAAYKEGIATLTDQDTRRFTDRQTDRGSD